jgi:MinD-like ATPase involved in chromosome partitioning or flagellar assembly
MSRQFDVPLLGKIPFDPRIAISADEGTTFVAEHKDSPAGSALMDIAAKIQTFFLERNDEISMS